MLEIIEQRFVQVSFARGGLLNLVSIYHALPPSPFCSSFALRLSIVMRGVAVGFARDRKSVVGCVGGEDARRGEEAFGGGAGRFSSAGWLGDRRARRRLEELALGERG